MTTHRRPIRVGVRTRSLEPSRLRFLRQIGVADIFLEHSTLDEEPTEFTDGSTEEVPVVIDEDVIPTVDELRDARDRVEEYGMELAGIHSLPYSLYGPIMFGESAASGRLSLVTELIERLGQAGIPYLGYQWNPRGLVPMRTRSAEEVRGGAKVTGFHLEDLDEPFETVPQAEQVPDEATCWEYYEEFVEAVIPVAEAADVTLALHPTDPPGLEQLGGIPRLFRDVDSFDRAMAIYPSEHHTLKLCLGCFSQLGEDIPALIRQFGEKDQIGFVHFRDVEGTVPSFRETFVDAGNFDPVLAMQTLHEVGFEGAVMPDHVPAVEGDTNYRHRGRGYTVGYMNGIIDATHPRTPSTQSP